jgi:hypothetical protein
MSVGIFAVTHIVDKFAALDPGTHEETGLHYALLSSAATWPLAARAQQPRGYCASAG